MRALAGSIYQLKPARFQYRIVAGSCTSLYSMHPPLKVWANHWHA